MIPKKFKIWDKKDKEFIKNFIITIYAEGEMTIQKQVTSEFYEYKWDTVTLQYTGLEDDNGVEPCEKDIIEFEGENFILEFGHYGCGVNKTTNYGWHLAGNLCEFKYIGGGKAVGNIFENEDLLKAK